MAISNTNTSSARSAMQSSTVRGAAMVAIGLGIGQVFAYLLSLAGARMLGPDNYGIFGSMLALLMVGSVLTLGIQAAGARRIVLTPKSERSNVGLGVVRSAAWAALGVTVGTIVIAPAISWLLHLDGVVAVVVVALNLAPVTWSGSLLGVRAGPGAGRPAN